MTGVFASWSSRKKRAQTEGLNRTEMPPLSLAASGDPGVGKATLPDPQALGRIPLPLPAPDAARIPGVPGLWRHDPNLCLGCQTAPPCVCVFPCSCLTSSARTCQAFLISWRYWGARPTTVDLELPCHTRPHQGSPRAQSPGWSRNPHWLTLALSGRGAGTWASRLHNSEASPGVKPPDTALAHYVSTYDLTVNQP